MTLSDLTRRTAFRIAVIYAALFLATVAAIFTLLYHLISSEIEAKLKSHIVEIRKTLVDVSEKDGIVSLQTVINDKGPPGPDDEEIFLLVDTAGRFLAGNIADVPQFSGWKKLEWEALRSRPPSDSYEGTDTILAAWTPVKGGVLLVGDGNSDVEETQDLLMDGLWLGLALTLSSALAGGAWLGLSAQRRIDRMETALAAVSRGDLSKRIALTSTGDDLDHVARRINTTLDHLQSAVMTLGQVSTDIAHDLKTPIGRIRQRLDSVSRPATTIETYRDAVEDVRTDLDGVIATFEALLRIAQIEGGARKARFTDVDLKLILARLIEAFAYVGEDTGHRVHANLMEGEWAIVRGDRDLLTQLFANLIENSLRHCPPGTLITVALESVSGAAVVSIKDSGPGIPASERERVFRRLYRLEKSRTTPGNGLGLSLVAAIAALHDANVDLGDNNPGLAVRVRFPGPS